MRRWVRLGLAAVAILALGVGGTILSVEHGCTGAAPGPAIAAPDFGIADPGYRRAGGDSFMTYPEWNIVHAYADLAAVTLQGSESNFDYVAATSGFWRSLCQATGTAAASGGATRDQRITNYVIGFSFTAEMALQGLYERTLGALTAWWRGDAPTVEDVYARRVLDDYAAFLEQTPWYQFPFGAKLSGLWREPFVLSLRSVERRASLSLQYAGKSAYAAAIGLLAGYSPADLRIRSVVGGLEVGDVAAIPGITPIRAVEAPDGRRGTLIETPRYRAFTAILRGLGSRGRTVHEIAGNGRILTTVIARPEQVRAIPGATEIFSLPIQSRPGWRRIGFDTAVPSLAALIGIVEGRGARFEHAYDF